MEQVRQQEDRPAVEATVVEDLTEEVFVVDEAAVLHRMVEEVAAAMAVVEAAVLLRTQAIGLVPSATTPAGPARLSAIVAAHRTPIPKHPWLRLHLREEAEEVDFLIVEGEAVTEVDTEVTIAEAMADEVAEAAATAVEVEIAATVATVEAVAGAAMAIVIVVVEAMAAGIVAVTATARLPAVVAVVITAIVIASAKIGDDRDIK